MTIKELINYLSTLKEINENAHVEITCSCGETVQITPEMINYYKSDNSLQLGG